MIIYSILNEGMTLEEAYRIRHKKGNIVYSKLLGSSNILWFIDDYNIVHKFIEKDENHSKGRKDKLNVYVGKNNKLKIVKRLFNNTYILGGSKYFYICNLDNQKLQHNYEKHTDIVTSILVISKKQFATGSKDTTIKIWNYSGIGIETPTLFKEFNEHKAEIVNMFTYSENKIISCSKDGTILVWNYGKDEKEEPKVEIKIKSSYNSIDYFMFLQKKDVIVGKGNTFEYIFDVK